MVGPRVPPPRPRHPARPPRARAQHQLSARAGAGARAGRCDAGRPGPLRRLPAGPEHRHGGARPLDDDRRWSLRAWPRRWQRAVENAVAVAGHLGPPGHAGVLRGRRLLQHGELAGGGAPRRRLRRVPVEPDVAAAAAGARLRGRLAGTSAAARPLRGAAAADRAARQGHGPAAVVPRRLPGGPGHLAARPGDARARAGVGLARPTPPLDRRHRRRIDGDDRVPVAPRRNGYGPRARPGRTWPTAHPRRRPVVGHPSHLARPARRRPHPDGPVPVPLRTPRRRRAPAAERPAGEAPPVPSGGERAAAGAAGARAPGVGESPLGRLAVILGLGFATLGLLGFVVTGFAPLLGSSELLPFLHVDPLGNLLHLLVGMQLASASGSGATARPGPWVLTAAGSAVLLALPCADPLTLTLHATVAVLALAIAATRRGPSGVGMLYNSLRRPSSS